MDGEEGEDECQKDREQAHADWHIVLDTHDDANEDDDENKHRCPHPNLNHLFGLGWVFNKVFLLLLRALFQVRVVDSFLLAVDGVGLLAASAIDGLADEPEDLKIKLVCEYWRDLDADQPCTARRAQ